MADERHTPSTLTEAGRARRARMQGELLAEMQRVHRARRVRRRSVLSACALTMLIGGLWFLWSPAPQPTPTSPTPGFVSKPDAPGEVEADDARKPLRIVRIDAASPTLTQRIRTDEGVLDRYRIRDEAIRVMHLSDEELVEQLAAIGEPVSVIRLPDRVLLVRAASNGQERRR